MARTPNEKRTLALGYLREDVTTAIINGATESDLRETFENALLDAAEVPASTGF